MEMNSFLLIFFLYLSTEASVFPNPRIKLKNPPEDAGKPLILTPYLNAGAIDEAQNLSRVSLTTKIGFESHAGFFTVDEKYNSNLYFWYFPAFSKDPKAPVVLWLQGGPGGSSLFGLFEEIGPLTATEEGFAVRKYHWARNFNLIFIDNPVGTGFSFTNDDGYCEDETCIGRGLYNAMQQFFTMFPKLRRNKFFITGESYAGKYIPALGMEIHRQNPNTKYKINLSGMAMGNAYCDPVNQLDYGKYLYQHGLIDRKTRQVFELIQADIADHIRSENWEEVNMLMKLLMFGEKSYFRNNTHLSNYYNYLKTREREHYIFPELLQITSSRKSIHVGNLPFNTGDIVHQHLADDMYKSVASDVATLLSHYKILIYNGQLDIIVAYPLTENFLRHLKFDSAEIYKRAKRVGVFVNDEVVGYLKSAGNLTEMLVRNAGHMVPADQPRWAYDIIHYFILGTGGLKIKDD